MGNAGYLKQSTTPSPACHSGIYSRNPASASPQTLQKKLIPASPPHAIVRPRPRAYGRKRNERLGGIGSGSSWVAMGKAQSGRMAGCGYQVGQPSHVAPGKPGGAAKWSKQPLQQSPARDRRHKPKIPSAWGDGRFIYINLSAERSSPPAVHQQTPTPPAVGRALTPIHKTRAKGPASPPPSPGSAPAAQARR